MIGFLWVYDLLNHGWLMW